MPSGTVDAIAESAIILVAVLFTTGTLERIRGLCLEHKLRRGKSVSLQGRTLTFPETFASLLFVVGIPIVTLLASLGRNGRSTSTFNSFSAAVDVWDTDISMQAFYRDVSGIREEISSVGRMTYVRHSVYVCGIGAAEFTPQAAIVNGQTHCPGSFNVSEDYATPGFVYWKFEKEKPPESLFPAQKSLIRSGDWRSQCVTDSGLQSPCFAWKWTQEKIAICELFIDGRLSMDQTKKLEACKTFKLGPGAPPVNSDEAWGKIALAYAMESTEMLRAHFIVSTTKYLEVDMISGEKQVTVVEPISAAGFFSVLTVTSLAWLLTWLVAQIAPRRRGYNLRLHTYSGLAAYAASLEDKYITAAGAKCIECNFDSAVDDEERAVQEAEIEGQLRPYISLRPGEGHFAKGLRISHSPDGQQGAK